jgi:cellulose synthase/poly-beta-1,6-N-acetylglucosamine synthase-like glycosyltransferase
VNINAIMFWAASFLILYTYALYPLILFVVRSLKATERNVSKSDQLPSVSVVVAVYNEEETLHEKMKNLFITDYPREKVEFLFGSDGSDDKTNQILQERKDPALKVEVFPLRRGKAAVLNRLIPIARSEIVVLSDANTFYLPTTIRKLVQHFSDSSVGAVCGELTLESDFHTVGGIGEGYYWRYENKMKQMESDLQTTVGATGAVYAIRKELFRPLPEHKPVMDDFIIPLNIVKQGYVVRYEPQAKAHERPSNSVIGEFRRKVRISAANFYGLSEFSSLLHPRYGFAALALWSRKILRWCVPFLMIVMIIASLFLAEQSRFFRLIAALETVFLASAFLGLILEKAKLRIGILGLPYYFVAMNAALLVGFVKFALGRQSAAWDVIRS